MSSIASLRSMEILDSRGRPTLRTEVMLDSGASAAAAVPSGASTGAAEAWELRDGGDRYLGLGCRRAVGHVNGEIAKHIGGREWNQESLDRALIELDGTANKARLGANAILSVSMAFARAAAREHDIELYEYFASLVGGRPRLPGLTINLFSGGCHAGGQVPVQDCLIVPQSPPTICDALEATYRVYQTAAELVQRQYNMRALTADEGGLAPPFPSVEAMFTDAVRAIEGAGFEPGSDFSLAIDVASSQFHEDGAYQLAAETLSPDHMIDRISGWVDAYPIRSVEDGLFEEDWCSWKRLTQRLAGKALVLGDDFLCTNPARIHRAVAEDAANALLLKVNQIGTLTEAAEANRVAREARWQVVVSARSGETEDNWLADLAVGWAATYIKVGSITQSERLAKYNRLLEIESKMHRAG